MAHANAWNTSRISYKRYLIACQTSDKTPISQSSASRPEGSTNRCLSPILTHRHTSVFCLTIVCSLLPADVFSARGSVPGARQWPETNTEMVTKVVPVRAVSLSIGPGPPGSVPSARQWHYFRGTQLVEILDVRIWGTARAGVGTS